MVRARAVAVHRLDRLRFRFTLPLLALDESRQATAGRALLAPESGAHQHGSTLSAEPQWAERPKNRVEISARPEPRRQPSARPWRSLIAPFRSATWSFFRIPRT